MQFYLNVEMFLKSFLVSKLFVAHLTLRPKYKIIKYGLHTIYIEGTVSKFNQNV